MFQSKTRPSEGSIETIPLSLLYVDHRYQRPISSAWVKKIAARFDPRLVNILIVSWQEDGRMAILDGQHRYHAMRRLPMSSTRCLVYEGLTLEQEADLFTRLNSERHGVSRLNQFEALYFAGAKDEVAIKSIVNSLGLKLYGGRLDGCAHDCIQAIGTLQDMYSRFGEAHVRDVLGIFVTCWLKDMKTPFEWTGMVGTSMFLEAFQHDPNYKEKHALARFSKKTYGDFIKAAQSRQVPGWSLPYYFAVCLVDAYNGQLHNINQLDSTHLKRRWHASGAHAH